MDDSLQPIFSLIVPTQGAPQLSKCIEHCKSLRKDCNLELIIIADNEQQIASVKARYRHDTFITFSTSHSGGVSSARNRGLELARGQFFVLMDDDCLIENSNLLSKIAARSLEQPHSIHGGTYFLLTPNSYWAKIYNWINFQWLKMGLNGDGHQVHLLGGFMFGHSTIGSHIRFDPLMLWGGEEKEMLQRLIPLGIIGRLHADLAIDHHDNSGFRKFIKRALYQGYAAGLRKLGTQNKVESKIPLQFIPGLVIFYCCSRLSIFCGRLAEFRNRKQVTAAHNSPAA